VNRFQRWFTGSYYDHVGLLVRDKKSRLQIFDVSSNDGVACTYWSDFIHDGEEKYYETIAYRDARSVGKM
jgi:hypothetical protein